MSGLRPPPFKCVVMLTPALGCLEEKLKKCNLVFFLLSLLSIKVFGFDKQNQVISDLQNGNYENVKILLQKWEKENPNDPDLMTGWYNYYLNRNLTYGNFEGYMGNGIYGTYSKAIYDEKDLKTAISYLDKALKNYPYRMDIHFGKINSLLNAEHYSEAIDAIIYFLKIYDKNKKEWYWSYNQSFTENQWNVEEVIIDALNSYCHLFDFSTQRESIKKCLETILKYFPKNVIFLNYMANYYVTEKNYTKSIEFLLEAYKYDPNDYIIVANLAFDYEDIQNYEESRKWFKILASMNSEEAKKYGNEGLERLKNK